MAVLFFVLSIVLIILLVIYFLLTWNSDYWKKRNVPHLKPKLLFGNYKESLTLKKTISEEAREICQQFPNEPYIGTYYGTKPALLVQDPELIKLIFAKDFISFNGRELTKYVDKEKFTQSIFHTYGDQWKVARQNISLLFTSSKLRNMFPLVQKCAERFQEMLEYESKISKVLEARSIITRYTMDCICSLAFGIDANVTGKDAENNPFRKMGDTLFDVSKSRVILSNFRAIWPAIFYGIGLKVFSSSITEFFNKITTEVFVARDYKPSPRNDFVDLLLNLKGQEYLTCESIQYHRKNVTVKIDDDFLSTQCALFFSAGFETSATASSALLYRLAKYQEIQKKLVEEIDSYLEKRHGKIEYDCVTELPYLEACIKESMRLSPVIGFLTREVMEPYVLPSGLKLEPGLPIHIPVYHIHHHPGYFSDPEAFKPERFLQENKEQITPFTFMPFGEGHRICLGMRVAWMQMVPGVITVLRNYRLELAEDMPEIQYDPLAFVMISKTGIPLKFIPRSR